jgi:hypothetical protein
VPSGMILREPVNRGKSSRRTLLKETISEGWATLSIAKSCQERYAEPLLWTCNLRS